MTDASFKRVEAAIKDLRQGKMIILIDAPDRENEADIVFPAEKINADTMNFIIRHSSGIVCLALTELHVKKLGLSLMVSTEENSSMRATPFTVSIDAKTGITTGVSASDRAKTVQVAVRENVCSGDIAKPGHIFPLQAKNDGVLARAGHTEGAVDIMRLAGLMPAAVLCEIMNSDGTMMRGQALDTFAKTHQLTILSIEDIIAYRRYHENLIVEEVSAQLPISPDNYFQITVVKEKINHHEHVVLTKDVKNKQALALVRIHSSCLTGDLFGSMRCDCNQQLNYALHRINKEGGILIYLNQEGRGAGLFNKIKAYSLQEAGADTVEANRQLGLPVDARQYYIAAHILRRRDIQHIRLLTNNPAKVEDLKKYGMATVTIEPMPVFCNEHNKHYLKTKKDKLNHFINHDFLPDTEGCYL